MNKTYTSKLLTTLLSFLIFYLPFANGQTTIWSLDFETEGGYATSITEFTDGFSDYFLRTDGSDISSSVDFTNIQGSYYFAAQDIDGEGAALPVNLTIDDVDISNYSSIEFKIYLAEDDDGTNQDWDDSDYLHIKYDIDNSGTFSNLLSVEMDVSEVDGTNGFPSLDTDFDGDGDGAEITSTFTQYTQSIPGTGNLIDITLEFNFNSGDEDIAIDNIELVGTLATTNDKTSVVDADGVTQPDGAVISSLTDDVLEAVHVFQFNIVDAGSGDGELTKVTGITFKAGPNNTADWAEDVEGGYIQIPGATLPLAIGEPVVTSTSVTFPINEGELEITDGGSQLLDLYLWLDSTTTDNAVIEVMVDADAHGFMADPSGSVFASDFTTDIVSNQFMIEVVATDLWFLSQPSDVLIDQTQTEVSVGTTDENGNIDTDNGGTDITLAYSGAGTLSGTTTVATTAGIAEFTDLSYDTGEAGVNLTATGGSLNGAVSEAFDVSGIPVVQLPYSRDFETGDLFTDGWSTFIVTGSFDWELGSFGGNTFAEMSNYSGGNSASETWLISPAVNLDQTINPIFSFYSASNHSGDDIEVYVSADYDGFSYPYDNFNWDTLNPILSSGNYDDIYSGGLSLEQFIGDTVFLAFKYTGTDTDGKTWQVDDIMIEDILTPVISNLTFTPDMPLITDPVSITADITDDGAVDTAFVVWYANDALPADYDTIAMENTSGDVYATVMDIPAQDTDTVFVHIFAIDDEAGVSEYTDFYTIMPTPSLYEIQFTQADPANSPYEGMVVRTTGIVTANDTVGRYKDDGFFFQDSASAWNGIYVHDFNENDLKRGDSIVIVAEVDEYFNLTELKNIVSVNVIATEKEIPAPIVIAPGDIAEPYEGVLVQLQDVTVSATRDSVGFGQFKVTDGTDTVLVDDDMIRPDVVKDSVYTLTGIVHYSFGAYKLLPRDIADIDGYIKVNMVPEIDNITISPAEPTEDDIVVLSFIVTDDGEEPIPADSVSVMYGTVDGTYDMEAVTTIVGFDATKFSATIPQMAPGTVYYKITASDTDPENPLTAEAEGNYDVDVAIGISTYTAGNIDVFPNPNKGAFILEIANVVEGEINLSVLDIQGRILESQVLYNASGETFRSNIVLQNADKGLYILRLENGDNKFYKRLVIE